MFRNGVSVPELFAERFLSRWVFDVELIARYIRLLGSPGAAANGIYEFPLSAWADIKGSRLKPTDFAVAFWDVVRIHWKYMRHVGRLDNAPKPARVGERSYPGDDRPM